VITKQKIGTYKTNPVFEYTIANATGANLKLVNIGAAISQINMPNKKGKLINVVLGYNNIKGHTQKQNHCLGTICGRVANRIRNSVFKLGTKTYKVTANEGPNILHGGANGFHKQYWQATELPQKNCVAFTYTSPNGEAGFPGKLTTTVYYTLTPKNEVVIYYEATTTKTTIVNLTNHAYFNLTGGQQKTIAQHQLKINAKTYTQKATDNIPNGKIVPLKNTALNFTQLQTIAPQLKLNNGFDDNFVITPNAKNYAATLYAPSSGIKMDVFTTKPGIQLYTGNGLSNTIKHTNWPCGFVPHAGLCLETQSFPNAINQSNFPSTVLQPNQTYSHITSYAFSVLKK
jgi:aldose 1-epimerase